MRKPFAPKSDGEMNVRRCRQLVKEIGAEQPTLDLEVWAIAQGLAYIRVEGPLTRGVVTLVLHTEREVSEFRRLIAQSAPRAEREEFPTYVDAQGREHSEY